MSKRTKSTNTDNKTLSQLLKDEQGRSLEELQKEYTSTIGKIKRNKV